MDIIQSPLFKKHYSQLDMNQQEALEDVIWGILLDPTSGQQKKGRLYKFWHVNYEDSQGRMQLTYKFSQSKIQLVAVYKISQFI